MTLVQFSQRSDPAPTLHAIGAEQAIIGSLMIDGQQAFAKIAGFLNARHFSEPVYSRAYAVICERLDKGGAVDPVLVAQEMPGDGALEELGGALHLSDLVNHAPPAANLPDYAKAVFEAAVRRDVMTACTEGMREVAAATDGFAVVSAMRQRLEAIESAAAPDDAQMVSATDVASRAIDGMRQMAATGRPRGLMTGLRCIDRRLNGLKPGALVVIGGRPGMGKTGLARAIAHGAAVRAPQMLFPFLNLEMDSAEIMSRELASITHEMGNGVEYRTMDSGSLTPLDFTFIDDARQKVPPNLIFDERCASLSVDDVRRKVWSLSRRGRVGAVFIDYLQLMRRPQSDGRNEASVIAEMTRALKQLARDARTCVVLLSQLNRGVEQRDDKRPLLSDLRESGSIEQDADAVLFPFREHYYLAKAEPTDASRRDDWQMRCAAAYRRLDVHCAKQRGGPEGTDRQLYFAEFDYIEDSPE